MFKLQILFSVIYVKAVKFLSIFLLIFLIIILGYLTFGKRDEEKVIPRGFMAERQAIYEEEYV